MHCWWEYKLVHTPWRTVWRFVHKLKLPWDPAIPLLGAEMRKGGSLQILADVCQCGGNTGINTIALLENELDGEGDHEAHVLSLNPALWSNWRFTPQLGELDLFGQAAPVESWAS